MGVNSKLFLNEKNELYFVSADYDSYELISKNVKYVKTYNNSLYLIDSSGFRVFDQVNDSISENFDHNNHLSLKLNEFSPSLNWLSNSYQVFGIDEIGYLISTTTGQRVGPFIDQPYSIKSLIRDFNTNNIWIQRTDGNIEFLTLELCDGGHHPRPDYPCFTSSLILNISKDFPDLGILRGVNRNSLLFDNGIATKKG